MANIRLSALIESILNPNGRFKTLEGIYGLRNKEGDAQMVLTEHTADFETVYRGGEYLLKCPLKPDAMQSARWKDVSVYTQNIDCPHISPFAYLEGEMLVFDSADKPVYTDVILHRKPDGVGLGRWMQEVVSRRDIKSIMQVCSGLADMAGWTAVNGFRHGNISAKNIRITPDLVPVMMNYTHSSRNHSQEDLVNIGALVAALFVAACRPEVYENVLSGHIMKSVSLRNLPGILRDMLNGEQPEELRSLLDLLVSESEAHDDRLCRAIRAVSDLKPMSIRSLDTAAASVKARAAAEKPNRNGKYTFIGQMNDMVMRAYDGTAWRYIDNTGSVAIPGPYIGADDFAEGRAVVETDSGFGMIGLDGGFVLAPIYDDIEWDSIHNVAMVTKEGYSGLCGRNGESITGLIYDQILSGNEGLFPVKSNGRYGYISKDGVMVIKPQYDNAFGFSNGVARVALINREFLIDKQGRFVADIEQPVTPQPHRP